MVLAMLCLNFTAMAQEQNLGGLKPGDTLGTIYLNRVYMPQAKTTAPFTANELKGRAIILDFWATWCGTCISRFKHLQTLQNKFNNQLQIVLVNTSSRDTDEKVSAFMANYYRQNPSFQLCYAYKDKKLNLLFPTRALPHYVWIGADGIVKAITGWEDVTPTNIQQLINNEPLALKVKEW